MINQSSEVQSAKPVEYGWMAKLIMEQVERERAAERTRRAAPLPSPQAEELPPWPFC